MKFLLLRLISSSCTPIVCRKLGEFDSIEEMLNFLTTQPADHIYRVIYDECEYSAEDFVMFGFFLRYKNHQKPVSGFKEFFQQRQQERGRIRYRVKRGDSWVTPFSIVEGEEA